MVNLYALSPVLVPLAAGLLLFSSQVARRYRLWQALVLLALLTTLVLVYYNVRELTAPSVLFFSPAPDENFDLTFRIDPTTAFFSTIVIAAVLARLLIENLREDVRVARGALFAIAGAVAFFSAANWTTLTAAWLLADLGLLLWRLDTPRAPEEEEAIPWRALAVSQVGAIVFLIAGTIALNGGSSLAFDAAALGGLAASLVLLAAWMRSGLYPFHFGLSGDALTEHGERLRGFAIPSLLGFYLLVRVLLLIQRAVAYPDVLDALALIGVGATALLVVTEKRTGRELAWATRAVGAPAFLLPFVAVRAAHPAIAVWLGLGLFNFSVLATGATLLRAYTPRQPWTQVLWVSAIFAAAGFPLTPGFLGRIGLYAAALRSGQGLLVLAVAAATTLVLIILWRALLDAHGSELRAPRPLEYLGIALMILPMLAEGLAPFVIAALFGRAVEDASAFAYDAIVNPPNIFLAAMLLAAVLLPVPMAFVLARNWFVLRARLRIVPSGTGAALELSGVARVAARAGEQVGILVRQAFYLIEQHPIGWLLFAAIWLALLIFNTRGS